MMSPMAPHEATYDAVWPKSPRGVGHRPLAERLPDLDGRRVAFLWDHVFRGDEIFPALADELTARFPACEIVSYDEFGNTHGGDELQMIAGLPDALASRHMYESLGVVGFWGGSTCG